jgi:hypothetical protein
MKRLISLFTVLIVVMSFPILSFAKDDLVFTPEDIKTIQNDSVVPRKVISNSDNLFKINEGATNIEELKKYKKDQNENILKISTTLAVLFLIIQIVYTVIGKQTTQDLLARVIKAVIMNVLVTLIIVTGITITNQFTIIFGYDQNFTIETIRSMKLFVATAEDRTNVLGQTADMIINNQLNNPSTTYTGLTGDVFCLKTIQDQYRVVNLILNWITVLLTYLNWLILFLADIMLTACFYISPFIGYLYILGDRFSVVGKFWKIFWDSALAKSAFYITYGIIFAITTQMRILLTNSTVNLEFAFYTIASLVALLLTTYKIRDLFKIESVVKVFSDKINQISSKI